jgi:hypothetical protein
MYIVIYFKLKNTGRFLTKTNLENELKVSKFIQILKDCTVFAYLMKMKKI